MSEVYENKIWNYAFTEKEWNLNNKWTCNK